MTAWLLTPRAIALFTAAILLSLPARAGIVASATRVIFTDNNAEKSLMLVNTNPYQVLVQTWIDHGNIDSTPGNVTTPFVAVPAIFTLEPNTMQGLRIVKNNLPLPTDRESVFWLNLYEIPPTQKVKPPEQQSVLLTMNTQMKVFYRPAGLKDGDLAANSLRFTLRHHPSGANIICHNSSAFFISFAAITLRDGQHNFAVESQPDMMTPPFAEKAYQLTFPAETILSNSLMIKAEIIDDTGNSVFKEFPLY